MDDKKNNNVTKFKYDKLTIKECQKAMENGVLLTGTKFKLVPDEFKTQQMCIEAVNKYKSNIKWVPEQFFTPKMRDIALRMPIHYIPAFLFTKEMCINYINISSSNIQYIPDEFKTKELCNLVIQNECNKKVNPYIEEIIQYIPDEFKTQELCDYYIDHAIYNENITGFKIMENIPEQFRTKNIYYKLLENHKISIDKVPKEYITQEYLTCLVKKDRNLLPSQYIFKYSDLDLLDAIKEIDKGNVWHIRFIPDKYITSSMCEKVFRESLSTLDGLKNLEYIPSQYMSEEMLEKIFKMIYKTNLNLKKQKDDRNTNDAFVSLIKCLPRERRTKRIWGYIFNNNSKFNEKLSNVPLENLSERIILNYQNNTEDNDQKFQEIANARKRLEQQKLNLENKNIEIDSYKHK